MDLDETPDGGEALLSAVAQWHRNRSSRAVDGPEAPAPDALKRAQIRVSTQFPVAYATRAGEECADGRAADLSTGGLSLSCKEPLGEGRLLLLRFTLPSDAVESMEGDAIARQPFAEMQLSARVVWRRAVGPGLFTYGLVFFEIDSGTRAEINRYVEAVRAVTSPARRPPA